MNAPDWNFTVPTTLGEACKVLQRRIEVHRAWAEYFESCGTCAECKAAIAAGIGGAETHRLYIRQYEAIIELMGQKA